MINKMVPPMRSAAAKRDEDDDTFISVLDSSMTWLNYMEKR